MIESRTPAVIALAAFVALASSAPAAHADEGTFIVLYNFDKKHGASPSGAVAVDAQGNIFGTASAGGRYGQGVLFEWSDAGGYVVLHDFRGPPDDGAKPLGSLVFDSHGTLWGTTAAGGPNDAGTIFRRNAKGRFETFASLDGAGLGSYIQAGLAVGDGGKLYGVAKFGGDYGEGTVFVVHPSSHVIETIYEFTDDDLTPKSPAATPNWHHGRLLGTTSNGGIWSMDGRGEQFDARGPNIDNSVNFCGVTTDDEGNLWGAYEPNFVYGMLWKIDAAGNYSEPAEFGGTYNPDSGGGPTGAIVHGPGGELYGTTSDHMLQGWGTIYRFEPESGHLILVHGFQPLDGETPFAGLSKDGAGRLVGVTLKGGANNAGTLYRWTAE